MKLTKFSDAAKISIVVVIVFLVLVGGIVADFAISSYRANQIVSQNNQKLCRIVNLATRHKVPKPPNPKANPSRESSYEFYQAFLVVKQQYNCQGLYLVAPGQSSLMVPGSPVTKLVTGPGGNSVELSDV